MFEIDYKRLVVLLLPTFLRKPVLFGLLRAAIRPLEALYGSFRTARDGHLFRLTHNGQVCYLQSCLNSTFGVSTFRIGSVDYEGEWLYAVTESGEKIPLTLGEDNESDTEDVPVLYGEESLNAAQNDFIVYVPSSIYDTNLAAVEATVNKYKLITKRAHYIRVSA